MQPTIFQGVTNKMRIGQEEVFGSVLSVIRFKDDEENVEIANDALWVNMDRAVSCMSPFGGYKFSGLGRENGQDAIRAYMQTKSVWINTADSIPNPFIVG